MSEASDQITEYLSVGGLFNPEIMNQTQHEAVRDTLIKARDDIQSLERYNAALREQVEKLDANWKMAEDQCFDQVGKIGELERENAALRTAAVEVCAIARVWVTVWGDKLSPDTVKRFAELEKQILKNTQP